MSVCIKTGARVLLEEYNSVFSADIHFCQSANVYIININPASDVFWELSDATWKVKIGDGYFNDDKSILVIGPKNVEKIK